MVKKKISEKLKRLFDYSSISDKGLLREYKFYGFDGKETSEFLRDQDKLSEKLRCPRDGVRMVIYSGEPHNVVLCPNCQEDYSRGSEYSRKKDLSYIKKEIEKTERTLEKLKTMEKVIENPKHKIIKANLEDKAMNK